MDEAIIVSTYSTDERYIIPSGRVFSDNMDLLEQYLQYHEGISGLPKVENQEVCLAVSIQDAIHAAMPNSDCLISIPTDRLFVGFSFFSGVSGESEWQRDVIRQYQANNSLLQLEDHWIIAGGKDFDSCMNKLKDLWENAFYARSFFRAEADNPVYTDWYIHVEEVKVYADPYAVLSDQDRLYVLGRLGEEYSIIHFPWVRSGAESLYFSLYSRFKYQKMKLGLGGAAISFVLNRARAIEKEAVVLIIADIPGVKDYYFSKGFTLFADDEMSSFGYLCLKLDVD